MAAGMGTWGSQKYWSCSMNGCSFHCCFLNLIHVIYFCMYSICNINFFKQGGGKSG